MTARVATAAPSGEPTEGIADALMRSPGVSERSFLASGARSLFDVVRMVSRGD